MGARLAPAIFRTAFSRRGSRLGAPGLAGLKWHIAYCISLSASDEHLALRLHRFNNSACVSRGLAMVQWLKLGAISLLLSTLLTAVALLPILLASS